MAIHASQGRRSGGSKKNSRRGYGKVVGAASSGAGSQQSNAARHAKQGPRGGGEHTGQVKRDKEFFSEYPLVGAVAKGVLGHNNWGEVHKAGDEGREPFQGDEIRHTGVGKQGGRSGGKKKKSVDKPTEPPSASGGMFSVPPEKLAGVTAGKTAGLVPDTEGLPDIPSDAPKKGAAAAGGKKGAADLMTDLDASSKVDLPKSDVDEILQTPPEADAPADGAGGLALPPAPKDKPSGKPAEKPYMAEVPVVTGADSKNTGPSSSGSTSWDHSALKEARAARAKLDQIRGTMGADAYSGDIGSYISKSNAVAALARQAQAAEAQGSVISRSTFDSDMGGSSGGYDLGSSEVPTQPDSMPKAAPMPAPADMPLSTVKAGDPEPNHQAFIKKPAVPAIAKNVVNPNKFKNFA